MENTTMNDVTGLKLELTNQDTNTTNDMFYEFVHGLYVYAIPIISMLGILGNICSMKVFIFTYFRKYTSSIYLTALSLSDMWFLLALLVGWFGSLNEQLEINSSSCLFVVYITYVTSFLSVWLVVMIMVDRYIVVCHPLKKPKFCSKTRATIVALSFTTFALVFYSHIFFTVEIVDNLNGKRCTWQEEYFNAVEVFTYIDTVITFVAPFITATVMSIRVIFAIRKFSYKHISRYEKKYYSTPSNTLSKAQYRLTEMLIVVTCVFILLNMPSHAVRFYILVNKLLNENRLNLILTQQICQILYYINFAVNFFLYAATSKSFRRCLLEPVMCKESSGVYSNILRERHRYAVRNIKPRQYNSNSLNRPYVRKKLRVRFQFETSSN